MDARPEEFAKTALDMFCRAAEEATGDRWGIQRMENGDFAVVQTFKAAEKSPDGPDGEKEFPVTGAIHCMSSGGLAGLASRLAKSFERNPLPPGALPETSWPLPFLDGCSSVEEMAVRLAACGGAI